MGSFVGNPFGTGVGAVRNHPYLTSRTIALTESESTS